MLAERNTFTQRLMLGRTAIGFIISRIAADEAEILSVAVAARRIADAAIRASYWRIIWDISRDAASVACFSKSKRTISPRSVSISAPASQLSGGGNSIIATQAAPN